jgi:predicted nucleic acid-binding Zn ribbon protein
MVDKYQKIRDDEKAILAEIHDEIDRKTNKRVRILLFVSAILILVSAFLLFY